MTEAGRVTFERACTPAPGGAGGAGGAGGPCVHKVWVPVADKPGWSSLQRWGAESMWAAMAPWRTADPWFVSHFRPLWVGPPDAAAITAWLCEHQFPRLEISEACLETSPCQHGYVRLLADGSVESRTEVSSTDIWPLVLQDGFRKYPPEVVHHLLLGGQRKDYPEVDAWLAAAGF